MLIDLDRDELKQSVLDLIRQHEGPENAITQFEVFRRVTGRNIIPSRKYDFTRLIRSIVEQLRREGEPIGNKGGHNGGYFYATDLQQLNQTIAAFHARAISSFKQEAALRKISERELIQQYALEFETQTEEELPA